MLWTRGFDSPSWCFDKKGFSHLSWALKCEQQIVSKLSQNALAGQAKGSIKISIMTVAAGWDVLHVTKETLVHAEVPLLSIFD